MLHFYFFNISCYKPADWCVAERHLFIAHGRLTQSDACAITCGGPSKCWWHVTSRSDGPDIRRESRFFYTLPALATAVNFHCMTRMHSADYTVAVYSSVRPSVCLSHAGIMSSSKFFSPSGSPRPNQTGWQYSDWRLRNGGIECKWVWKNHDFRSVSRFISDMIQDRAIVTTEGE